MPVRIVRLGTERAPGEGLRIGTVRRPPRGVRKADYAVRNFYDVWLPILAPSAAAVKEARQSDSERDWERFVRRYRREMRAPAARLILQLLARFSAISTFSVGCYCADESRCHRSILRELLRECGAKLGA